MKMDCILLYWATAEERLLSYDKTNVWTIKTVSKDKTDGLVIERGGSLSTTGGQGARQWQTLPEKIVYKTHILEKLIVIAVITKTETF